MTIDTRAKWTWSTRHMSQPDTGVTRCAPDKCAGPGDVVIVRVEKVSNHSRIYSADGRFSQLYPGDTLVGVFGTRYATDAFHALKIDPEKLHLLTNAGLIGTVCARHSSRTAPTTVKLIGYAIDKNNGCHLNLKDRFFKPLKTIPMDVPLLLSVGTGMNSGKTTTTARVGRALIDRGYRIAILKVTGSVSHRDLHEFEATGAQFVHDFSDYGFPSTYLSGEEELLGLFCRMVHDAVETHPDFILAEIADGIFQQEVQLLLKSKLVQAATAGVILTAACAPSAICLSAEISALGYRPIAVSGLITNSPLFVQEFNERSTIPVLQSAEGCRDLVVAVVDRLQNWKDSLRGDISTDPCSGNACPPVWS
ncbi:MAG: hypothetical protein ACYC3X_21465 [Pirellulaceae bacterium]